MAEENLENDEPISYCTTDLRKPQSVADLGRECTALHHVFGVDMTRKGNFHFIEDNKIIYASAGSVVFENIDSGGKQFLLGIDEGGVGSVSVHPTRKYFAVGGKGNQPNLYIYSYPDLKIRKILRNGAERGYACLSFSAAGDKLASVSTRPDFMLTIWDWEEERMGLHAKAFGQDVTNVQFSLDDPRRLTSSGVGHIRFWKMAATFTGLKLQGFIGKFGKIDLSDIDNFVELPDGKVVSGTETGSLLLWEGNFIKCRFVREGGLLCHEGNITFLQLDRREKCLISASLDGYIRWWDFSSVDSAEVDSDHSMDFELVCLAQHYLGPSCGVQAMIDSGAGGVERSLVVLDTRGKMQTVKFSLIEVEEYGALSLHTAVKAIGEVISANPGISAEAEMVVSEDGAMKLERNTFGQFHSCAITGMDTCPADYLAATCASDGTVKIVHYVDRTEIACRKFDVGATCLKWLPQSLDATGKLVATGFADGVIRVLGLGEQEADVDEQVVSAIAGSAKLVLLRKLTLKPHTAPIVDLCFSSTGAYLASAGKDGIIFFFECRELRDSLSTWTPLKFVTIPPASPLAAKMLGPLGSNKGSLCCEMISWSSNDLNLVVSCSDGVLREVDLQYLPAAKRQSAVTPENEHLTFEADFPVKECLFQVPLETGRGGDITVVTATVAASMAQMAAEQAESEKAKQQEEGQPNEETKSGESVPAATGTLPPGTANSVATVNTTDSVTSVIPLRTNRAIYAQNKEPGDLFLSSSAEAQRNFLFSANVNNDIPESEVVSGLYTVDEGKDFSKHPVLTSFRYSWSSNYIAMGASDGSLILRPTEYSETFTRTIAHNGAAGGTGLVAMSFDDRFAVSAGFDGTLVVHRVRVDLLNSTAPILYKDLDAGIYDDQLVKSLPKPEDREEPAYLDFVSTTEDSPEDKLFHMNVVSKRASQVLKKGLMFVEDEVPDVPEGAYSIQDNRLKVEQDAKKVAADILKERVRASIKVLQRDYLKIQKENESVPEIARLTGEQMLVDKEFFGILAAQGREMVAEVHRECAYEAAKAERLLKKIADRVMTDLLIGEMTLTAFETPSAGDQVQNRISQSYVKSLRTQALDNHVQQILQEVHAIVREAELKEAQQRTNEMAQKKALSAMDQVKIRLTTQDSDPEALSPLKQGLPENLMSSADSASAEVAHESTAAVRRLRRKERKQAIQEHMSKKPNEDEDDVRDLHAIQVAEKTIGDYKLKCAEDYEVPEDQRINTLKKVRQMAMLEESMFAMRLHFNDRFLALRKLKRQIVFSVRRDNARIRDIDRQLKQPELSEQLWEPALDPLEFPDDADEVTEAELVEYRAARKGKPWASVDPPAHRVVTGEKTEVGRSIKTAGYEVVNRGVLHRYPDKTRDQELKEELSDEALIGATPPRDEPPRYYEVDDTVLRVFVDNAQGDEIDAIKHLEIAVPALRRAKTAIKRRLQVVECSDEQELQNSEQRKKLMFERKMILKKQDENIKQFREAVDDLRTDRHSTTTDLKLAELKLLVLFQEYKLLQTFEEKDSLLQQKQLRCKGEEAEIISLTNENRVKLEGKQDEIQHWNDKLALISLDFKQMLPDAHPYFDILSKIFKKKVKRNKNGDDEESDDDDEDDDDDEEDEDEEVEDICPPGCDHGLFEKILDLREKKLDTEEITSEIQKGIEDLKKTIDRLKQREKQIIKEAQQTEVEVQQFQLQKQAALNQIPVVVPLRIKQIYMFQNSGKLTGPTDKSGPETEMDYELMKEIEALQDPEQRSLVTKIGLNTHTLFSNKNLVRLKDRIMELHHEIDAAKEDFKHLHKERGVLIKEREVQEKDIAIWSSRCRDLQMLKFGREIDLDELESSSDRSKEHEAEAALHEDAKKFEQQVADILKESTSMKDKLIEVTKRHTQLLEDVAQLTDLKLQVSRELNAPGQVVTHASKLDNFRETEEQKRIKAYVKFQATELEALRTELNMLKRKEAPRIVMSQTLPPGAPQWNQESGEQDGLKLPQIPDSKKKKGY